MLRGLASQDTSAVANAVFELCDPLAELPHLRSECGKTAVLPCPVSLLPLLDALECVLRDKRAALTCRVEKSFLPQQAETVLDSLSRDLVRLSKFLVGRDLLPWFEFPCRDLLADQTSQLDRCRRGALRINRHAFERIWQLELERVAARGCALA